MGKVISQGYIPISGVPFSIGFPLSTLPGIFRLAPCELEIRSVVPIESADLIDSALQVFRALRVLHLTR
jgi:hypothetical protein